MTTPKEAPAVVTREHRLSVLKCEWLDHLVKPGNERDYRVVFVEGGDKPGDNERWHRIAQAIADAESRGRAQATVIDGEVEADLERDFDVVNAALNYDTHPTAVLAFQRIQDRIEKRLRGER